ncbi:MAG TPA: hypothetical protein VL332_05700 [Candidatus Saccharimonadaceae bacterium]|nr:hypothetical protein [Candidatus Saccharimonadaceae bacterium]
MAHAYTPGLRVTDSATLRRERRLPLKGTVRVAKGDRVEAADIVARCELPGNVQTLNIASRLSVDAAQVTGTLRRAVGEAVRRGEVIAEAKALFGLMTNRVTAPTDGVIENVSSITGQLILREPPLPVEVNAFVDGVVVEVIADEGVVVETRAAFLQGIFGVGGETFGEIAIAVGAAGEDLTEAHLGPQHRGKVVVGGAYVSHAALMRAREVGATAVVVGGFDDRDLRQLLGRDLGVAITGSEDLGITLVLTEGFGRIPMAERSWTLLQRHQGQAASVSGATQIRAGVMRPEILIAHGRAESSAGGEEHGLEIGSLLRVIRQPYFGRIGQVVGLPAELHKLESEAMVRVLVVEFADDHSRATVPRANVELIAG